MKRRLAVAVRQVLADGVALVPVDSTLALLKVDRVRGQVPVHYGVAVQVEVETFLAD